MKPIRIFQHASWESPGYLLTCLERRGIPCDIIAVHRGERIQKDLDGVRGLVFLGSRASTEDPFPWLREELLLMVPAVPQPGEADRLVYGIALRQRRH